VYTTQSQIVCSIISQARREWNEKESNPLSKLHILSITQLSCSSAGAVIASSCVPGITSSDNELAVGVYATSVSAAAAAVVVAEVGAGFQRGVRGSGVEATAPGVSKGSGVSEDNGPAGIGEAPEAVEAQHAGTSDC